MSKKTLVWAEFVTSVRDKDGTTQKEFARKIGIPLGSLRRWEQGINLPNIAALHLVNHAIEKQGVDLNIVLNQLKTY